MKLLRCDPRFWSGLGEKRHGKGVMFDCPTCVSRGVPVAKRGLIFVAFANPLDGGKPAEGAGPLWQREGSTYETLTLSPSIDASKDKCNDHTGWHGFLKNGELITA